MSTPELNNVAALTGKSISEVKSTMKETTTNKGDRLIEDKAAGNDVPGEPSLRGAIVLERSSSRAGNQRKEAHASEENLAKTVASPRLPPALVLHESRGERVGRGRASKTSTPITSTFAEVESVELGAANGNGNGFGGSKLKRPVRPRTKDHGLQDSLSPKGLPLKRSHKKGAGLIQQFTSAPRVKEQEAGTGTGTTSSIADDGGDNDDISEDNAGEDEEKYCYCQGVSYGEMVACDNKDCPREWFHLECIGLKSVPKSAKWYCDECKENLTKKGKISGNGGSGNGFGK